MTLKHLEKTPTERIRAIAQRQLRRHWLTQHTPARTPAQRRARLREQSSHWFAAIYRHDGRMRRIAAVMQCDPRTAKKAIWDLGLWPELVAARHIREGK